MDDSDSVQVYFHGHTHVQDELRYRARHISCHSIQCCPGRTVFGHRKAQIRQIKTKDTLDVDMFPMIYYVGECFLLCNLDYGR